MTELYTNYVNFITGKRGFFRSYRNSNNLMMRAMKSITLILFLSLFAVSCTSVRTFDEVSSNYDDIYYNPDDEKAPAPAPVKAPETPYRFQENMPETRVIEPQSPETSSQNREALSDPTPDDNRGYASDGYSYEEHFGRLNGNRNYNRGYQDGYEDALDDQYYDGFYNSYRAPVYYNTWNRGWNRPFYRSYPRNNFWIGYSHRSGWRYGYSYSWGYNGWNCYGPAWYDPYPWGYGYGGWGYPAYGGWGYSGNWGWNNPWYGHRNYGWGSPWYGYSGGYYRPYAHYPFYGNWGGYRNVNPPSGGGGSGSGSGGGVIINNPGQGTVNAPRTTVGSNGPTIGRNDQGSPRGRSGKLEAPGNDGAMNPTEGGLKESVARPDAQGGKQTVEGHDQGRNNLPIGSGPLKSDDQPGLNQPTVKPEQGRPAGSSDRTPVSSDRPVQGSDQPGTGERVGEVKPDQPDRLLPEYGRDGRSGNERVQSGSSVPADREYTPSRQGTDVKPSQPVREYRPSEDFRRQESRPTPSYETPSRESRPPREESKPSENYRRYESRPTPSYESPSRESSPGRQREEVRPSQPRYESRPAPSYESPSRSREQVRPQQPRQESRPSNEYRRSESRPQPSYSPSPQRSQSPSNNYSRESNPSPSRAPSPSSPGSSQPSGRGRSPR